MTMLSVFAMGKVDLLVLRLNLAWSLLQGGKCLVFLKSVVSLFLQLTDSWFTSIFLYSPSSFLSK